MPSAERCRIGVQLWPQATTTDALRHAAVDAEAAGVDSVWVWDHFFPLRGEPEAAHFESWTLLAAMAVETSRVELGHLVGCASFRNPHLVADMARTVDHLSGGRFVLGLGAGWYARDYEEYEYPYGTSSTRVRDLDAYLYRVRRRLARLAPAPVGPLPILVGGMGEQVTLRLVATHADIWNGTGEPAEFAARNRVLDQWCERVGRDPSEIVRTCHIALEAADRVEAYVAAGAQHLMIQCPPPFDLEPAQRMLAAVGA
jgi:probable F420-dependent oxidoreductase